MRAARMVTPMLLCQPWEGGGGAPSLPGSQSLAMSLTCRKPQSHEGKSQVNLLLNSARSPPS